MKRRRLFRSSLPGRDDLGRLNVSRNMPRPTLPDCRWCGRDNKTRNGVTYCPHCDPHLATQEGTTA